MVPQTPETESTRSVNFLASAMPAEETLSELADLFHVLGDLTRIRILCALSISELRVSEIAELLSMSSSAISHQLRVLRQARLVRLTRKGRSSIYALDDDHVRTIFDQGFRHVRHILPSEGENGLA